MKKYTKQLLKKEQILTIPNLLSVVRLVLIPFIIWIYVFQQNYNLAILIILISGATDILDGFIARKFHMISDFGKILDPIADKLTQLAVIICLSSRYKLLNVIIVLFIVKELIMLWMGYVVLKKQNVVNGAKWYGKANTVILYIMLVLLIFIPDISIMVANVLIVVSGIVMILSLSMYVKFYISVLKEGAKKDA